VDQHILHEKIIKLYIMPKWKKYRNVYHLYISGLFLIFEMAQKTRSPLFSIVKSQPSCNNS